MNNQHPDKFPHQRWIPAMDENDLVFLKLKYPIAPGPAELYPSVFLNNDYGTYYSTEVYDLYKNRFNTVKCLPPGFMDFMDTLDDIHNDLNHWAWRLSSIHIYDFLYIWLNTPWVLDTYITRISE